MSEAWQRSLARVGLVLVLAALVMAPTPGAVGGCGHDDLDRLADLPSYCKQREQLICVRRSLRREITDAARDQCRRDAIESCDQRFWAPQCRPTERQTRACLNALSTTETLEVPEEQIEECQTDALCKLPPRPRLDAGAAP